MTRQSVVAVFERHSAAQRAVKQLLATAAPARLDVHEGAETATSHAGHAHG